MSPSRQSPLVQLREVSHQYSDSLVLRDVDWTLEAGEAWALLGPSGSGKTTLARITGGYLWPNEGGDVIRGGKTRYNLSEWRRRVGWLSTDLLERVPESQTILDTVLAGVLGQTRLAERRDRSLDDSDRERATSLLEAVGFGNNHDRAFRTLSQGETQLVLVARALVSDPDLIVLDEPCAGMDPGAREHFLDLMTGPLSRSNPPAIIYVTHHPEEILPTFEQVLLLKNGTVTAKGSRNRLLTTDRLNELYEIDQELCRRKDRYWLIGTD